MIRRPEVKRPPFFPGSEVGHTVEEIGERKGLRGKDLEEFESETPPVLAGTAVPLLGNFGSVVGTGCRPEYTLLRERTGSIGWGNYNFPGGKTDCLLELTAWEETREEMPQMMLGDGCLIDGDVTVLLRRVNFLAVADQIFIDREGELRRFLNYVFGFWLAFPYSGGGPGYFRSVGEGLPEIRGVDGDCRGEWVPVSLDQETMGLADPEIEDNLSPIASVAMKVIRKRFGG